VVDVVARLFEVDTANGCRARIGKVPFTPKASRPLTVEEQFPRYQ
jgi:hypothetical protein